MTPLRRLLTDPCSACGAAVYDLWTTPVGLVCDSCHAAPDMRPTVPTPPWLPRGSWRVRLVAAAALGVGVTVGAAAVLGEWVVAVARTWR